jgi:ATPase family AAA domain-containing protein 2
MIDASTNCSKHERQEFFQNIIDYIKKAPKDFPDPVHRKLRKLESLPIAPPPPPRMPTKEEIKALKKKDHMMLNLLKTLIQPIMDQIKKNKYRKFRNPIIPQSQIQYLFDEQDPDFVRPDIPQQRPYELSKDKDGIIGLRETATGKFFYNLEIVTIEERLSNGFYARPKDYLADIVTLAKDAKNIGDKERLIQANELVANVEVDLAVIEADPRLADAENVYQRQLQRAKEKTEKAKKRAEANATLSALITSDIPGQGQGSTTDEASGPIVLGEMIPGRRLAPIVTPYNAPSSLSNGDLAGSDPHGKAQLSNGSSDPLHGNGEDVHMGGTDDGHTPQQTQPASQQMNPPHSQSWGISRVTSKLSSYPTGVYTQSQTSGFQQIPHDTSPTALINDASTTTSGKKTSQSNRSSDAISTQVTNGKPASQYSPPDGDSQLPDTQRASQEEGTSSDEQWLHSQAHGIARGQFTQGYPSQTPSSGSQQGSQPPRPPLFGAPPRPTKAGPAGLANILNDPGEPNSSQSSSQKDIIIDEAFVNNLLETFVKKSSGCSIEQLEQINRELMDTVWKERGEYNRTKVATTVMKVFNEAITDIEEMQKVLQPSQDDI